MLELIALTRISLKKKKIVETVKLYLKIGMRPKF